MRSAQLLLTYAITNRAPAPRCELGFKLDPAAVIGPLFVLSGYAGLQLKIRASADGRRERDAARELARIARTRQLAGELSMAQLEQAERNADTAQDDYDRARLILALPGGTLVRIPDPSAKETPGTEVRDGQQLDPQPSRSAQQSAPEPELRGVQQQQDPLYALRNFLGLQDPEAAPPQSSSLMPSGSNSITIKDVAIGFALTLQIGWFFLSLTDPMARPGQQSLLNTALQSGGEYVDQREAKRSAESAEYRAMLQAAVDSGQAPPTCATLKLGDPEGGCGGAGRPLLDPEYARTRGLDANREWISGPPPSSPGL